MTLREKLNSIKESEIFKLDFENKVFGLRVKYFNVSTDTFEYYDFDLSIIKNQGVINFINGIKDMRSLELIRVDGLLATQDEIANGIIVREFEDESSAIKVLQPFIKIYKYKGVA